MNEESKYKMPDSIDTVVDVVHLCLFAKEATNMDDAFSKGMREAFDYIVKCCNEHCRVK